MNSFDRVTQRISKRYRLKIWPVFGGQKIK